MILLLGGICGGFCFASAPDGAAHSCCHGKSHCGHAGPAMHSDQPMSSVRIAPVILSAPLTHFTPAFAAFDIPVRLQPDLFSPPVRSSILRL